MFHGTGAHVGKCLLVPPALTADALSFAKGADVAMPATDDSCGHYQWPGRDSKATGHWWLRCWGVDRDQTAFVSVKRVCEALGLDNAGQQTKLKTCAWAVIGMIPTTANDGKKYETFCIDLKSLPMWPRT